MKKYNAISVISILLTIMLCVPIVNVLKNILNPSTSKILPSIVLESLLNTLTMIVIVGFLTVLLASSLAWIVSIYEFKGRKLFHILLLMPFSFPPYIMAQSYADFFSYTGIIPTILRNNYGIRCTIDMMNIKGAILIYVLSLFVYIYLFCLSYYHKHAQLFVENSRLLGVAGWKMYREIGLKLARIPIISGLSLVIMELISDYGVVSYYGIRAFTTVFYKIWISLYDFSSAIKLAALVMGFIFLLLGAEHWFSKNRKFYATSKSLYFKRITPKKSTRVAIYCYLTTVVTLSFIIPLSQLIYNNYFSFFDVVDSDYLQIIIDTLLYCSLGAFLTVFIAFLLVNFTSNSKSIFSFFARQVATLGYSIPGIIIAISVMFTFHELDKTLRPLYVAMHLKNKLLLSGTSIALVFAYVVRFITISYNQLYSGRAKYHPNLFEASRLLGKSQFQTMCFIDVPLLKESGVLAFLLVFLEILKELPITLLLKPIGLNTLTIEVHKYHTNEMIKESSVPSLIIVLIGIILNLFIFYYKKRKHYVKN